MQQEYELALVEEFPDVFMHYSEASEPANEVVEPFARYGFQCGDGWVQLIRGVAKTIHGLVNSRDGKESVHAVQVKEKFGALRFYTDRTPGAVHGATRMAEYLSEHVCYDCGTMEDVEMEDRGRILPLCESCAADRMHPNHRQFSNRTQR